MCQTLAFASSSLSREHINGKAHAFIDQTLNVQSLAPDMIYLPPGSNITDCTASS